MGLLTLGALSGFEDQEREAERFLLAELTSLPEKWQEHFGF